MWSLSDIVWYWAGLLFSAMLIGVLVNTFLLVFGLYDTIHPAIRFVLFASIGGVWGFIFTNWYNDKVAVDNYRSKS